MRKMKEFCNWMKNSSAQSFLAICDDGVEWIVRLKKKDFTAHRLFSEYFIGRLANEINLPHPNCEIVYVNHKDIPTLPDNYEPFDTNCKFGIVTKYMKNYKHFEKPTNYEIMDLTGDKFKDINKEHIYGIVGSSEIKNFYGIIIFSKWAIISDYHKYENLMINANNEVLFLDFDLGLSFDDKDYNIKTRYDYLRMVYSLPPFCSGIEENINEYDAWIDSIRRVKKEDTEQIVSEIPKCWEIDEKLLKGSIEILFDSREKFIENFIKSVEFRLDL